MGVVQPNEWFKDVLIVETIVTMNAAFCERHLKECPPSEELSRECSKVRAPWCPVFVSVLPW